MSSCRRPYVRRGINEYYKSDKNIFMRRRRAEQRISGDRRCRHLVQIDDPFLPDIFTKSASTMREKRRAQIYVEAINSALKGIRPNMCLTPATGSMKGRDEASLADIIDYVLQITGLSFEAANPRHEHEYHLFEREGAGRKGWCRA
jgi:5-methyltetrahydropteroyltriglutamate--homocysteine methyltransferase